LEQTERVFRVVADHESDVRISLLKWNPIITALKEGSTDRHTSGSFVVKLQHNHGYGRWWLCLQRVMPCVSAGAGIRSWAAMAR